MLMRSVPVVLLLTLAPAFAADVLSGKYQDIANCAYPLLDAELGPGISKTDLNKETRLTVDRSGIRLWQLTLTAQGSGTAVQFEEVRNVFGRVVYGDKVMAIVERCARQ